MKMSSKSTQSLYPFLVIMVLAFINVVLEARTNNLTQVEIEEHHNMPAIKTIMSDDGDIIDCVDIYKQPAFDHPLLKNHTIEMRPSFIPKVIGEENNSLVGDPFQQIWQKSGGCPEGTIPIMRIPKAGTGRGGSLENFGVKASFANCKVEVARVELHRGGPYTGAQGTIHVWDLHVEPWEWSLNSVTVFDDHDSFLETGWAVSNVLYGDSKPRVFVNWMNTDSKNGCFNLVCAGFVQVSNKIYLGAPINPSDYNGKQHQIMAGIYNDPVQKRWWAVHHGIPIGYWPWSIVPNFQAAPRVNWGGSVCNTYHNGFHTETQMGNGHFPSEGYRKTGHIQNILVLDDKAAGLVAPPLLEYSSSNPGCYLVTPSDVAHKGDRGPSINYGGPGGKCCDFNCRE